MKKFLLSWITCIVLNSLASAQTANTPSGQYFDVSAISGQLSISTNIAGWFYEKAGIKIINPGYALSGVGSECTMASNGYCIFAVDDTQPVNLSFTGPAPGNIEVSLCLNGSGAQSCQNYAASFAKINYAYISNRVGATAAENIIRCAVSDVNGSLSACTPNGVSPLATVAFLAMNPTGNTLYAVSDEFGSYTVYQCELNATGITSCSSVLSNNGGMGGTTINPAGNKYYYTANDDNVSSYTVETCDIDNSGALINCDTLAADFSSFAAQIGGMAFNPDGSLAYVTYMDTSPSSNFKITACVVNSDGTFGSCTDPAASFSILGAHSIAIDPENQYAYVVGFVDAYSCTIASDGSFSACQSVFSALNQLTTITLNAAGTIAYLLEFGGGPGQINVCLINSTTGVFDVCQVSGSGYDFPISLALSP